VGASKSRGTTTALIVLSVAVAAVGLAVAWRVRLRQ
jgi:hypothetical protein